MYPQARREELEVTDMGGELLVYDLEHRDAHSLNEVSAFIWRHCDGEHSVEDLVRLVERELAMPANRESVELALEQLSKRRLLTTEIAPAAPQTKRTRREALKLIAQALAIPIVLTVTARTAHAGIRTLQMHGINICVSDNDCPPSSNPCEENRCISGTCTLVPLSGITCITSDGSPGICSSGVCVPSTG